MIKDTEKYFENEEKYRLIATSSIMAKILRRILLSKLMKYLNVYTNQFGYKQHLGTRIRIFVLKELLYEYYDCRSTRFLCFLDASRVFEIFNHNKLF